MNIYVTRLFAAAGIAILVVGCMGEDDWVKNLPKTVEASGTVTLNGDPIEGVAIVAAPAEGGKHAANALSDSDGYFELKAFPAKEGAVPGQYKVMITKTIEIGGEQASVDSSDPALTPSGDHAAPEGGGGWKNALPKQYANPNSSGLTVDIPSDGVTDITFELKG